MANVFVTVIQPKSLMNYVSSLVGRFSSHVWYFCSVCIGIELDEDVGFNSTALNTNRMLVD